MRRIQYISIISAIVYISMAAWAQPKTINGTVTGPDEAPVENATVSLYRFGVDMERMSYDIQLAKELKTCSSGLFSYTFDESEMTPGHNTLMCYVQKPGLSMGFCYVSSEDCAIKLTAPQTLSGRVEDARGNPVADASVQLAFVSVPGDRMEMAFGLDPVPFFTARSDAEGKFAFTNLPENCTAEFMVKKPGLAPFTSMTSNINPQTGLTFAVGQEDIVLTLPDPCKINGVVMDTDGQPVPNVKVFVRESDIPFSLTYDPVETADDGTYTFSDLSPGSMSLNVIDPDWVSEPVTIDLRADMGVPLKVSKGSLLTVTVIDGVTDKPVPSANVNIQSPQDGNRMSIGGLTAEDGTLKKRLAPGSYNLYTHAAGYRGTGRVIAEVEEDKPCDITITLGASAKITGTVTDPDGKPLAGVTVFTIPTNHGGGGSPETDENGQFVLGWDPQQNSWTEGEFYIAAIHKDKNLAVAEPIDTETKEVQLKLQPGQTVTGKVIDPSGNPIAEARVNIQFRGSRFSTSLFERDNVMTDAQGVYSISVIPQEQRYALSIAGPKGFGTEWKQIDEPAEGLTITIPDVTLKIANLTVTGKVVDIDDKPIEGVNLNCHGSGQPNLQAKSDNEGKFTFDPVCEGMLQIHAWYQKDGQHLYTNLNTEGGAQDVTVVLSPRTSQGGFAPRRPAPLAGKPLPDLNTFGLDLAADPNQVLVCVWDSKQRPSRHLVRQLAEEASTLKEQPVQVVLLNASPAERAELDAWLAEFKIPFACGILDKDPDNARFNLGVQALPWLILTDADRTVIAEGFDISELTAKLEAVQ